jgi:hypothetical protein
MDHARGSVLQSTVDQATRRVQTGRGRGPAMDRAHGRCPTVHHGPTASLAAACHGSGPSSPVSSRYGAPGHGSRRESLQGDVEVAANSVRGSAPAEGLTTERMTTSGICKWEVNFGEHKPTWNKKKGHGTVLGGRIFTFRSSASTPRRRLVTGDGNRGVGLCMAEREREGKRGVSLSFIGRGGGGGGARVRHKG